MNDSVPESIGEEDVSVSGLSLSPDHVKGIVDSPQGSKSPGGSVIRKGFGLKKWRRIKRDGPIVKAEAAPVDDGGGSKSVLKRGLTGSVDPPFKHVDLSSVDARQSSEEGSVGSVNMVVNHHHHNGFSVDSGFMFTVGKGFEKGEEEYISGNSVGGKIVSGSEERVKTKEEKPCSSLDSDLRSSDFVFSSGAVSVVNHGEEKDAQVSEQVQIYGRQEEEDGDASKKNNHKDPIAESIRSFEALHEALSKEVKSFKELGKESLTLHPKIGSNSPSSGSQLLILKEKVEHLEHKLEEARDVLEAKETRIQELEISKTAESELECVFQRKLESEIEHLVLTRSLNSSLQEVFKQPKKIHTEDPEHNCGNMLRKTCKFGFYFLTQLILLVSVFRYVIIHFSPASRLVIPT